MAGEKKPEEKKGAERKNPAKIEKRQKKIIPGVAGIVRIAETDLDGTKKICHALLGIKGISHAMAQAVVTVAGIDKNELLGRLNEQEISRLEEIILNPAKFNIPAYMLNRRADPFLGIDRHMVSSELTLTTTSDISFMKKIRCYKGIRHELGLPVRGQRTRASFRRGMLIGVAKTKVKPSAAAPAAGAPAPAVPAKAPEKKPAE